ncbi:hypothetical protein BpHYR1_048860 [Brachionus plicatilis]|uniref:Uncharacterized protein n=1 Tax=Brachionus plicatilis TaxID=10195 RepID=A0A3M7SLK5_BRAPC|nr:hypothetical protein BpHYR1_048860 [Brachionus plicatilis]
MEKIVENVTGKINLIKIKIKKKKKILKYQPYLDQSDHPPFCPTLYQSPKQNTEINILPKYLYTELPSTSKFKIKFISGVGYLVIDIMLDKMADGRTAKIHLSNRRCIFKH